MAWFRRFVNSARSDALSRDLDREFAHHINERRDDLMGTGMSADDAEAEARRKFGNVTSQKERTRDVEILTWLETCWSDVRYAVRALRRSPAFALVAILSLALGIGANTAIFSLINAVMLKSLPVQHPDQLVLLGTGKDRNDFTNPMWEEFRNRQDMFAGAFAAAATDFDLTTGGEVRGARGEYVSGDYFNVLGVRPASGRLFSKADDTRGCRGTAVISDAFWASEFGRDPHAVGRSITLGGEPFEIIGVSDPAFFGINVGKATQIYAPICASSIIEGNDLQVAARNMWWLTVTARRRPDMSDAQLQARLGALSAPVFENTVASNWTAKDQEAHRKRQLTFQEHATGFSDLRDRYRTALYTLMVIVLVVLVIACGNVANLLLARARARQREAAVRLAVGAGRGRLVRQLLTESLVLSMLGTAAGVAVAYWGTRTLVSLLSTGSDTVWLDLRVDARVLAFTSATALVTGVLFGIAPAWRAARVDPQAAMRGTGRGITGERRGLALIKGLVVGQVALSLSLLVGAGLLLASFVKVAAIDLGFRGEGVLVVNADLSRLGLEESALDGRLRRLRERLASLPGVRSAATAEIVPMNGFGAMSRIFVDGYVQKSDDDGIVSMNSVSSGYFATMETPMLAGRDFGPSESRTSPRVAIVNEAVAKKFFHGENPVGRTFRGDDRGSPGAEVQIVGMVKTSKYGSVREAHSETIYTPASQRRNAQPNVHFVLRMGGSQAAVAQAVRSALKDENPQITFSLSTLDGLVGDSLARPRLIANLAAFFGALALMLAVVGLYGTMSYSVERRRNEIGVRIALGAARGRIVAMVLQEAGWIVAGGIVAGVGLSIAATRWVSSLLYGVTPTDAPTFALAGLALTIVALAASLVPAWRAARLDPMQALREE